MNDNDKKELATIALLLSAVIVVMVLVTLGLVLVPVITVPTLLALWGMLVLWAVGEFWKK